MEIWNPKSTGPGTIPKRTTTDPAKFLAKTLQGPLLVKPTFWNQIRRSPRSGVPMVAGWLQLPASNAQLPGRRVATVEWPRPDLVRPDDREVRRRGSNGYVTRFAVLISGARPQFGGLGDKYG